MVTAKTMTDTALDQASEFTSELAAARPTCNKCKVRSWTWLVENRPREPVEGWDVDHITGDCTRRCATCASSPRYPWASRLDPERVRDWLIANHVHGVRIDLDKLRRDCLTDSGGFRFL